MKARYSHHDFLSDEALNLKFADNSSLIFIDNKLSDFSAKRKHCSEIVKWCADGRMLVNAEKTDMHISAQLRRK